MDVATKVVNEMTSDPNDIRRFVRAALPDLYVDSYTTTQQVAGEYYLVTIRDKTGDDAFLGVICWQFVSPEDTDYLHYYIDNEQFLHAYLGSPDWDWKSGSKWVKRYERSANVYYGSLSQAKRALFKEPIVLRRIARICQVEMPALESAVDKSARRDQLRERIVGSLESDEWKIDRSGFHANGRAYVIGRGPVNSVKDVVEAVDEAANCSRLFIEDIQPIKRSVASPWQIDFTILQDAEGEHTGEEYEDAEDTEDTVFISPEEIAGPVLDEYPGMKTRKMLRSIHLALKEKLPTLALTMATSNTALGQKHRLLVSFGMSSQWPLSMPKALASHVSAVSSLAALQSVISSLGIQPYPHTNHNAGIVPDGPIYVRALHPTTGEGYLMQFSVDGPEDYTQIQTARTWTIDESENHAVSEGLEAGEFMRWYGERWKVAVLRWHGGVTSYYLHKGVVPDSRNYSEMTQDEIDRDKMRRYMPTGEEHRSRVKVQRIADYFNWLETAFMPSDRFRALREWIYAANLAGIHKKWQHMLDTGKVSYTPTEDTDGIEEGNEDILRGMMQAAIPALDDREKLSRLSQHLAAMGVRSGRVTLAYHVYGELTHLVAITGNLVDVPDEWLLKPWEVPVVSLQAVKPILRNALYKEFSSPQNMDPNVGRDTHNERGVMFTYRILRKGPIPPHAKTHHFLQADIGQEADYHRTAKGWRTTDESMDPKELYRKSLKGSSMEPLLAVNAIRDNLRDAGYTNFQVSLSPWQDYSTRSVLAITFGKVTAADDEASMQWRTDTVGAVTQAAEKAGYSPTYSSSDLAPYTDMPGFGSLYLKFISLIRTTKSVKANVGEAMEPGGVDEAMDPGELYRKSLRGTQTEAHILVSSVLDVLRVNGFSKARVSVHPSAWGGSTLDAYVSNVPYGSAPKDNEARKALILLVQDAVRQAGYPEANLASTQFINYASANLLGIQAIHIQIPKETLKPYNRAYDGSSVVTDSMDPKARR
jgi:hypothetical protein